MSNTHLCTCRWVPVEERLPEVAGKYVIKTKCIFTVLNGGNCFEARLMISGDNKTWDISRQTATHWLEELRTHLCT